jgi:hypothetical protein
VRGGFRDIEAELSGVMFGKAGVEPLWCRPSCVVADRAANSRVLCLGYLRCAFLDIQAADE